MNKPDWLKYVPVYLLGTLGAYWTIQRLARINHKLRSEMQREVLGYKAGTGFRCELYEYIL